MSKVAASSRPVDLLGASEEEIRRFAREASDEALRDARARVRRELYGGRVLDAVTGVVAGGLSGAQRGAAALRALVKTLTGIAISLVVLALGALVLALGGYAAWRLWRIVNWEVVVWLLAVVVAAVVAVGLIAWLSSLREEQRHI